MAFWKRTPAPPSAEAPAQRPDAPPLCCSFCGKSQQQVLQLIAGPTVYICDECVSLCTDIVAEKTGEAGEAPAPAEAPRDAAAIEAAMRDRVVGHAALVALLARVTARNGEAAGPPPTLLLVGGAGVGKTRLCSALVAASGVPAAHAHAHRMTATGYIGADLENVVQEVVLSAGDQPARAARGLLVFEDLHHLALRGRIDTVSRDVGGRDVQPHLVRLLDRRDLSLPDDPTRRIHPQAPLQAYSPDGLQVVLTCRLDDPPATEPELRAALLALGLTQELLDRVDLVLPVDLPDPPTLARVVHEQLVPELDRSVGGVTPVDDAELARLLPLARRPGGAWNLRQALIRRALLG